MARNPKIFERLFLMDIADRRDRKNLVSGYPVAANSIAQAVGYLKMWPPQDFWENNRLTTRKLRWWRRKINDEKVRIQRKNVDRFVVSGREVLGDPNTGDTRDEAIWRLVMTNPRLQRSLPQYVGKTFAEVEAKLAQFHGEKKVRDEERELQQRLTQARKKLVQPDLPGLGPIGEKAELSIYDIRVLEPITAKDKGIGIRMVAKDFATARHALDRANPELENMRYGRDYIIRTTRTRYADRPTPVGEKPLVPAAKMPDPGTRGPFVQLQPKPNGVTESSRFRRLVEEAEKDVD